MQETSGFCDYCQQRVLGRREGINHVLHFLVTMFTCGLWVIPWIIGTITHGRGDYACPHCGGKVRTASA